MKTARISIPNGTNRGRRHLFVKEAAPAKAPPRSGMRQGVAEESGCGTCLTRLRAEKAVGGEKKPVHDEIEEKDGIRLEEGKIHWPTRFPT